MYKLILTGLLALFGASSFATPVNINVLTAFTTESAAAVGGTAGMTNTAAAQVALINQAFVDSGISANVHATNVGYVLSGNYRLEGPMNSITLSNLKIDQVVRAKQRSANADVVILINNYTPGTIDGFSETPDYSMNADANRIYQYAITRVAGLPTYAYLHEFGHVMNGHHQTTGGLNNDPNPNPLYAHPWVIGFPSENKCYATVMWGNSGGPCPVLLGASIFIIPRFANQHVLYRGFPIGDSGNDNATAIVNMAPIVTQYHLYTPSLRADLMGVTQVALLLLP